MSKFTLCDQIKSYICWGIEMLASYLISKIFRLHDISIAINDKKLIESAYLHLLYQELTHYLDNTGSTMETNSTIRNLVNDLLSSNEYSIDGLATYTGYPEDVIFDIAAGMNNNPTLVLAIKIIELHILYRQDLYIDIAKRIAGKISRS